MLAVVRRADELVAPGAGGARAMGVLVVGAGIGNAAMMAVKMSYWEGVQTNS